MTDQPPLTDEQLAQWKRWASEDGTRNHPHLLCPWCPGGFPHITAARLIAEVERLRAALETAEEELDRWKFA